ncbi:MAG: metal ABC transporter permease [Pseudomonadota bacterium]
MLDDFFARALIAGIGIALTVGPLGCVVVWRQMAYFGDTISHSALLGAAIAVLLEAPVVLSVFGVAVAVSALLLIFQRGKLLPSDALLGILSHSMLAIGLVAIASMSWLRIDVMSLLFGDILSVGRVDLLMIWGGGAAILAVLSWIWQPLLSATINEDLARADGLRPERTGMIFTLLLALVIALAIKLIGILLITALLIIPAATARRFSSGPEQMAVIAAVLGAVAVVAGLFGSLHFDTPSGPSIVVTAFILFVFSHSSALLSRGAK